MKQYKSVTTVIPVTPVVSVTSVTTVIPVTPVPILMEISISDFYGDS